MLVRLRSPEKHRARLAPPEQEIVEPGLPVAVQTHDLAVKDDRPLQFGGEGFRPCAERFELVLVARDELRVARARM